MPGGREAAPADEGASSTAAAAGKKPDDAGQFQINETDKSARPKQAKLQATDKEAALRFFVIDKDKGPIEGIVGFPFFARFNMTLDYQAKTMTLVPNGYDPPDVMRAMQAALMSALRARKEPVMLASAAQWGMVVEKKEGDEDAGVTVVKVLPGGPAAKAGLKVGDRVLTIDERWTDSVPDTFRAAGYVKPGSAAAVVIKRDGKEQTIQVKPTPGL